MKIQILVWNLSLCVIVIYTTDVCVLAWSVHGREIYIPSIWTDGRSCGQSKADKQQTVRVRA